MAYHAKLRGIPIPTSGTIPIYHMYCYISSSGKLVVEGHIKLVPSICCFCSDKHVLANV